VSIQEIGDTVILATQRPAKLDTAHLVQSARIGRFDGPEEYLLFGQFQFTVGWRGEVYVAYRDGIRVFSPDGLEVRRIARGGEGPGEVVSPYGMAVDEGGRLLVVDARSRRVAVFDTSGAVLDHWRLPYGRPGNGRSAVIPIPGNQTFLPLNPLLDPRGSPQPFPRPILVRLDSAGAVLDTVFAPSRLTQGCPTLDEPYFSRGYWQDLREPMFPKVKWTASSSGEVLYGCPAVYEIDRVQPDGTVLRVSHEREPMIESEEGRRFFVESWDWISGRSTSGWRWQGSEPPEQKPYFHRMIVGRGGRLWVWPGFPTEPMHDVGPPFGTVWSDPVTGAFDVFDTDGSFLGPVLLPDGAEYKAFPGRWEPFIAGDTVWLIRQDSLDVKYLDRMLIEW